MSATFEIDTRDLDDLDRKLELCPREAKQAMVASVNRALSKIITNTANEVKKVYPSVKRKDIKDISKIKKATFSDTGGTVTYTGERLKASTFPHTISRSKNRSPVTLKIKGSVTSGGNPVMFGERVGGTRGAKGKREVFKRDTGQRKVETVYTLSIPQMVANEKVFDQIAEQAHKDYLERFEHEYNYRIGNL